MKKVVSLLLALSMLFVLCACGSSSNKSDDPQVVITKDATVSFVSASFDKKISNILHVDFNYKNTGDKAKSLFFTVDIKAYQDGKELFLNGKGEAADDILPGYDNTSTYSFILETTDSPVLIQYCSWGKTKVSSEFSIELPNNK